MRVSFKPDWILDGDELVGIYFDNGGCAEHEMGISRLERMFGIDRTKLGIEGRTITSVPEYFSTFKYKSCKVNRLLMMSDGHSYMNPDRKETLKNIKRMPLRMNSYNDAQWISAAWSDSDFAFYAAGDENVAYLEEVINAFNNKDIAMFVGNPTPNNPFSRGGLVFFIVSKMPEKDKQDMYDADVDYLNLQKAAAPTIEMLRKAGKKYYACSPRWKDEKKSDVVFWLNPWDQQNNYFGWVTKQDLKDWTKNKGFIPGHGFAFERANKEEYNKLVEKHKVF